MNAVSHVSTWWDVSEGYGSRSDREIGLGYGAGRRRDYGKLVLTSLRAHPSVPRTASICRSTLGRGAPTCHHLAGSPGRRRRRTKVSWNGSAMAWTRIGIGCGWMIALGSDDHLAVTVEAAESTYVGVGRGRRRYTEACLRSAISRSEPR